MEALSSSDTSVLIRATRRNIPEDPIFHDTNIVFVHLAVADQQLREVFGVLNKEMGCK
jgi:hypothetical protein